jgi:zinc transporter ZupT
MQYYGLLLSVVTLFSTLFGGLLAARYRSRLGWFAAFAAGVLIAVPLFDLLPETFKIAIQLSIPLENAFYAIALGFIFLYILERYFSVHRYCEGGECHNVRHRRGGWFGAGELSAHSYMDGLAIGIGFQFPDIHVGIIIAFAVISHDFSDGINTVTVMLNSGNSVRSSLKMLLVDAATPVLGAFTAFLFVIPQSYVVLFLPFFAGGFLYIGASDLLPEAHRLNPPATSVIITLAGFALIFVVTRILGI